jgi:hypothetical protein
MSSGQAQKSPAQGRAFGFLVAGTRYTSYMQIEIEPFPPVALAARAFRDGEKLGATESTKNAIPA